MNLSWTYICTFTDDDRDLLTQVQGMIQQWDQYPFQNILQTYREFDFLLKRSMLELVKKIPPADAYSALHHVWMNATHHMHLFFTDRNLFESPADSIKLKDLIELSFFYGNQLTTFQPKRSPSAPVISVVMPVYRAQQYLWEALRSIYEQTFQNFEIILVNEVDNDDPLKEILSVFGDTQTVILQKTERARLGNSLNLGIQHAKGEFIARMDADDIAHPERFAKQIEFFRDNLEVDFCGTQYRAFGTSNTWQHKQYPLNHVEIQCRTIKYCSFLHPTVMWRRERLMKHQLWYNEEILAEDTDLFARIVFTLKTANLPETLLLYRREEHNLSIHNLQVKNEQNQNLAVIQSLSLEKRNLKMLCATLTGDEQALLSYSSADSLSYRDALQLFRYRLGRTDLSALLPPDTSDAQAIMANQINNRTPVIWGYGWNGHVLEFSLQEQGFHHYKIVDQRMQKLGLMHASPHMMNIEQLRNSVDAYYVVISMDRHFPEVTEQLQQYGFKPEKDYIEYFLAR